MSLKGISGYFALRILFSCFSTRLTWRWPGRSTTTPGRSIDRIEMNIESIESKKYKTPLLKELSQSSQDSFESESDPKESRNVRLNSSKNCIFSFLPLLKELSRSSQDSFKSESGSKESWDDGLNSFKSGVSNFSNFFEYRIDRIDRTYRTFSVSIVSIEGHPVY